MAKQDKIPKQPKTWHGMFQKASQYRLGDEAYWVNDMFNWMGKHFKVPQLKPITNEDKMREELHNRLNQYIDMFKDEHADQYSFSIEAVGMTSLNGVGPVSTHVPNNQRLFAIVFSTNTDIVDKARTTLHSLTDKLNTNH